MASDSFENRRRERRERRLEDARNLREFRDRVGSPHTDGLTPQAIYHWRCDDQIGQLIEAGQGEPGIGFITALLATCSLPRTDPGDAHRYVRRNGPFSLLLTRSTDELLPYGILPRLLLAWVCTEVVRTQSPKLRLGPSLAAFMRDLGVQSSDSGGRTGVRTRLRDQMHRLFGATLHLKYESQDKMCSEGLTTPIAEETHFWWQPRRFKTVESWRSTIQLGTKFFEEIIEHPVPIDLNVLRAMKRSSLGVDIYVWLTYRMNRLPSPVDLRWVQLYRQFAPRPENVSDNALRNFRRELLRELGKIKLAWPELQYEVVRGRLRLKPSRPRVERRRSPAFFTS